MNNFCVLMAVYWRDDPELLDIALQSVYDNTVRPEEVILVQDGEVGEEISAVVRKFVGLYGLRVLALSVNSGLAKALNFGLKYVSHDFVFRADADDYNMPNRFAMQLPLLQAGYDLVGGSIVEVDRDGNEIALRVPPRSELDIRCFLPKRNPFNHMTVAFRRSAVGDGYPDIHLKEDYALWATMIAGGTKAINMSDVLVRATAGRDMYRRRGGLRYVRSELDMQRLLVSLKLQSLLMAAVVGSARSAVFLLPSAIRGFIYERFLRNRINKG